MIVLNPERDLSSRTSLAISIVDGQGLVRSSSQLHAWRLGRRIDEVLDQDFRPFLTPSSLEVALRSSARALAGEPQLFSMAIRRSDNRVAVSRLHLTPLRTQAHGDCFLAVHSGISISEPMEQAASHVGLTAPQIAGLVRDLAAELASMASTTGLVPLAASLDCVAGEVGDLASRLR